MSETDKLARMVRYGISTLGAVYLLLTITEVIFGHVLGADDTDSATRHSGMLLRTDFGTGCQYLEGRSGITPRFGSDGRQICGARR